MSSPAIDTGPEPTVHGEALTLPKLFELLRDRSPRYKAAQAEIEVAKSRLVGARALPNPIFNFQVLQLFSGYNQNGFGTFTTFLQQPLFIGGQRQVRKKAAKSAIAAAEAKVEATFHALAADGRHRYADLQAQQREKDVLIEAIADLERLRELVAGRHASGAESRYDVARITLEVRKWEARVAKADAEIRDASGRLAVLVGRPSWRPEASIPLAPVGVVVDADRTWQNLSRTQPEIRAAQRVELAAHKDVIVAKRDGWPTPTLGFGMVAIDNFYSISGLGGLIVPMPIFDWNQGPVARAKAEEQRARLEKETVIAETHAELERSTTVLRERKKALAQFERDVISVTPELRKMAEDAYVTGEASILELIDAVEARYELQIEQIELLEDVVHAEVDVLQVTGRVEEAF